MGKQPKQYYRPHSGTYAWTIHPQRGEIWAALDAGWTGNRVKIAFNLTQKQLEHLRRDWRKSRGIPSPHPIYPKHDDKTIENIRDLLWAGTSRRKISRVLNLTKGQLSGLIYRKKLRYDKPTLRAPTDPRYPRGTR